jgi:hypothetical protein
MSPCGRPAFFSRLGKNPLLQNATTSAAQKPWLFGVSPNWSRCSPHSRARAVEGFFHGQLAICGAFGGYGQREHLPLGDQPFAEQRVLNLLHGQLGFGREGGGDASPLPDRHPGCLDPQ